MIILEDDMEIVFDFFDYFEVIFFILDCDKFVVVIFLWNDNG